MPRRDSQEDAAKGVQLPSGADTEQSPTKEEIAEFEEGWKAALGLDEVAAQMAAIKSMPAAASVSELRARRDATDELLGDERLLKDKLLPPAPASSSSDGSTLRNSRRLLATPEELALAFGPCSDMNVGWFSNVNDKPGLKAARVTRGGSSAGVRAVAMYCPYQVMAWLLRKSRKCGRRANPTAAWAALEKHFNESYQVHLLEDPRGQ